MSCRWTLLFQLVVLIRGHLRRTKTDPVHGVSASVNAASQIDILEAQLHYTNVHAQTHTDRSVGFESLSDSLDHLQKNETQNVSQSWGLHGTIDSGNAFVLNTTEERRGGGWEKHVTPEHENMVQDDGFESPYPFVMVNLDRRIDRLQKMETTLPQWVCAKTCRVSATDSNGFPRPHYISEEAWSTAYARAKGRKNKTSPNFLLTPGAIALIESSRRVWEQIIFENATTIIVEDDIQVDHPQQLKDALSILHERTDWEMVFLQWKGTNYSNSTQNNNNKREGRRSPRMVQGCMKNTGMYALTPAAALKLRDALEKGTWNASIQLDGGYNGYRGIFSSVLGEEKIFHFQPAVAFQRNNDTEGGKSDIQIIHTGSSTCKINACESRKEVEEKKINITSYSLPNGTNYSLPFREREKFMANFTDRVNASDQVNT